MWQPVPLKALEEGHEWTVPAPPKRRARPRLKPRLWAAVLATAVLVGQVVFVVQLPLLRQVEARVSSQGVVCLSPMHVWGVNASAVSFANRSLASPRLLSGEGRVVSRETSTLCPGTSPKATQRYERVVVQHRTPPWPWRRTARLEGEEAVCMQHMLDLFRGVSPCSNPLR